MNIVIGSQVTVDKCGECPAIVGKTAKVVGFTEGTDAVVLSFGRGRPQANRPVSFAFDDISVIGERSDA